MKCYDPDGNEVDEVGFRAGVERAKLEVLRESAKVHERWSGPDRRSVAAATLSILKLNIDNLLY